MSRDNIFPTCHLEISGFVAELWLCALRFVGFVYSTVCFGRCLLDQFQFFIPSFMHREIAGKTNVGPFRNGDRDANSHLCNRYHRGVLLMVNIETAATEACLVLSGNQ